MSKRRQLGRRWSFVGGRMHFEPTFAGDDRPLRDPLLGGARVAFSGSTPSRDNLQGAALRALAFAGNHLLFPLAVVLLALYLFRDAPGGPGGFVDQIDRWLGFDELTRVFQHG